MRITVVSGGIGGSRFVQGVLTAAPEAEVSVVANTADDIWMFGLRVCPDLDTVMYTLSGGIDLDRRWGRADETWKVKEELTEYRAEQSWFGLGDRDLATHLVRTAILRDGGTLSDATRALCERWRPPVRLLPMSDDEVETHVLTEVGGRRTWIHFQEFWVRHRARVPVLGVAIRGLDAATPAPGVVTAISEADVVLVPPSNPIVSVGPIVGIPGVHEALRSTSAPVVGVSPVINGAAVGGMADELLAGLGLENSAAGVGLHHGARSAAGVLDGWLVDTTDGADVARLATGGIVARAVPLWMRDGATTAQLALDALTLAQDLR